MLKATEAAQKKLKDHNKKPETTTPDDKDKTTTPDDKAKAK
jgi:hypothetical protein